MHCGAEVTESSTNKQHHLSVDTALGSWAGCDAVGMRHEHTRHDLLVISGLDYRDVG